MADIVVSESSKELDDALDKFLPSVNLNERDKTAFLQIARGFGLNPFKREIYAIVYGNKATIVTGYEVYLKRAERSNKLDGWSCDVTEDGKKATCTIHRKDWRNPLVHVVYVEEARQDSPIWRKMPKFMLRKVAIGQAFRLAFPDELGGMPYLSEEISDKRSEDLQMPKEISEAEVIDEKTKEVIDEADKDGKAIDNLQDKAIEEQESKKSKDKSQYYDNHPNIEIIEEILLFAKNNDIDINKVTKETPLGYFPLDRLRKLLNGLKTGDIR